jgi:hypothetical protein
MLNHSNESSVGRNRQTDKVRVIRRQTDKVAGVITVRHVINHMMSCDLPCDRLSASRIRRSGPTYIETSLPKACVDGCYTKRMIVIPEGPHWLGIRIVVILIFSLISSVSRPTVEGSARV